MKKLWIILISILGVGIVGTAIWFFFLGIDIELNKGEKITSTIYEEYNDPGLTVKQHNKEIDKNKYKLESKNNVDKDKLGDYEATYEVKYRLRTFKLKRIVSVVDDVKPDIKSSKESILRDYCTKKDKDKLEYTITDNYDGEMTDKGVVKEEEDHYVIMATDNSGNEGVLNVPIVLTEKPKDVFKLNGNATTYVAHGVKYNDSGVTYTDGCGNKLEGVITSGKVDTSKNGTYTITYQNKDAELTRKVIVYTPSSGSNISPKDKVIYLTFDDGPCSYTEKVLNTLAKYNVKATFFVTHQFGGYVHLIKKEHEQGHAVAVHSYTHNWNIYKSVDAYVNDFNKMNDDILKYTGSKAKIFRFPGGSSNTVSRNYAKGVVKAIASRMTSNGYVYFDWDVDSGDAAGASRSKIYSNVVNGVKRCSKCVVLMHDIKPNTVNELDNILKTLTSQGYRFGTLSTSSPTVHHSIAN